MGKVYAFVANGSEEVELLAVVDVLLRGGQDVKLVSVTGSRDVVSAHQIKIQADLEFSEAGSHLRRSKCSRGTGNPGREKGHVLSGL